MPNTDGWVFENQEYELTLDTGIDLSGETGNVRFEITDPDGTVTTVLPSILSPATGGLLRHSFSADDLTPVGTWQVRSELITQKTFGRIFYLRVMPKDESSNIPSALEIREYLEGYSIDTAVLTDRWIILRRDKFIIPWIERKARISIGAAEQVTTYHSGTGSTLLILNARNVIDLISIVYTISQGEFSPSLSSMELVQAEGVIKAKRLFEDDRSPTFPRGKYNIKVTYTIGTVVVPEDIREAIIYLTAEQMLMLIADRTGGGALGVQAFNRNYGKKSKFSNIRSDLARNGLSILRRYMTGVVTQ